MASKARTKGAPVGTAPGDLQDVVLEAIRGARVIKGSQLKRALPKSYQRFEGEIRRALETIVERGEVWRRAKNKSVSYFARDPIQTLDELLPPRLPKTFDEAGLGKLIKELAPDHDLVLREWLASAMERRMLFERALAPTKPKAKAKRGFGREPDVGGAMAPVLSALRKALSKTDSLGVPRHRVLDWVMVELGLTREDMAGDLPQATNGKFPAAERDGFLSALNALAVENPRQALLAVRDLRGRLAMNKGRFDALAVQLSRDGLISLHQHDLPSSLTSSELDQYVRDERGNYYIGVAPRRGV